MKTFLAALLLLAPESDWSQWRGPKRDGLSPDTGLLAQWPSGGPALLWKATGLGEGFSSVCLSGETLFTNGDVGGASSLMALQAADGKLLWTAKIGRAGGQRNKGTRSTPATDGTLVFALGQFGELVCVEAATGKEKWRKHLETDFGGKMMSGWNYSESPLLDGENVLCTPGGSKGAVIALKKATGALAWQSAELKDEAGYASLVPVEIGAVRQYLVFLGRSVAGVRASDGKLLWRAAREHDRLRAVAADPIYHDGVVFVSSGYGSGCTGYRVTGSGDQFKVEEIFAHTQMKNHHGGMIRVGDHLYGLDDPGTLKCVEVKTGKVVWENRSVGKGSVAFADGHLVVRSESDRGASKGEIAWVEATPSGYKEKGRFTQPDLSGQPTWAHPVVFGGRLYIRDQGLLLCYDLKGK